jgi:hypothetical protein
MGVFMVGAAATLGASTFFSPILPPGSLTAGIVNNLMPIASIIITTGWITRGFRRAFIFRTVGVVLVTAMCINSVISMVQIRVNLTPLLQHFWDATSGATTSNTVALLAVGNGRYTGIFNQPAQAGILYGLALLMAVHLWSGSSHRRRGASVIPALLIIAGGFLTVSKVFILVAFPLFLLVAFPKAEARTRQVIKMLGWITALVIVVSLIGASNVFPGFKQLQYDIGLTGQGGFITRFSGGRVGLGGSLIQLFKIIMRVSPIYGVGLRGMSGAVDSSWTSVALTAGLIGVIFLITLSTSLIWGYFRGRVKDQTGGVGISMLILTIISSIGFPIFTGNRISSILWVLLTCLFLSNEPWELSADPVTRTPTA